MTTTKAADEVRLATQPLRILKDEDGQLQYREEIVPGADVINPQDGERFFDVFTSWHKGGFIEKFVQDGFYFDAINVDCTEPGRIRPGPRRVANIDLEAAGDSTFDQFGVCGLWLSPVVATNDLLASYRVENAVGTNRPNRVRHRWVVEDHTFAGGVSDGLLDIAEDKNVLDRFTSLTRPITVRIDNDVRTLFALGDSYRIFDNDATGTLVAILTLNAALGQGRIFKISAPTAGAVLGISNIDSNADLTVAGNWTDDVILEGVTEAQLGIVTSSHVVMVGDVPVFATPAGLFVMGTGGNPRSVFPMLSNYSGWQAALSVFESYRGGAVFGSYPLGNLIFFNAQVTRNIGPDVNPLAVLPNGQACDTASNPAGDLWLYIWNLDDNVWEVWVGKQSRSSAEPNLAWHPLLQSDGSNEAPLFTLDVGDATSVFAPPRSPMLPIPWGSQTVNRNELVLGVHDSRLLFLDGDMFYGRVSYSHEDDPTVAVQWRSGRYARHDLRASRHWGRVHFEGENISSGSAVAGGRIRVEVAYDGGSFGDPPAGPTRITSNRQSIVLNTIAREVELRLTWDLDGETGTGATAMRNAPATITHISHEGREVPLEVRRLTIVVDGNTTPQAGGVRQSHEPSTLLTSLSAFVRLANQTFVDPFKNNRTVQVLPPQALTATQAKSMKVPEGSILLTMLELV